MRSPLLPTPEQTLECFRVCYEVTKMYRVITLVRIDERRNNIVVFAGEETIVEVTRSGERVIQNDEA